MAIVCDWKISIDILYQGDRYPSVDNTELTVLLWASIDKYHCQKSMATCRIEIYLKRCSEAHLLRIELDYLKRAVAFDEMHFRVFIFRNFLC